MGRTRKRKKIPTIISPVYGEHTDQLALWTIKTMVHGDASRRLMELVEQDDVCEAAGILMMPENLRDLSVSEAPGQVRRMLLERLEVLESGEIRRDEPLFDNMEIFGEMLGLTSLEKEIFTYMVQATISSGLSECTECLPRPSTRRLFGILAKVLGAKTAEIRGALRPDSVLISTGLLKPDRHRLGPPYEIFSGLDDVLFSQQAGAEALFRGLFRQSPEPSLALDDYPHVRDHVRLISRYLGRTVEKKTRGVNVLLHGPPGTGKTELARALASHVNTPLYEVSVEDADGEGIGSSNRMTSYLTCHRVLERRGGSIVLFDEAEDIFPSGMKSLFNIRPAVENDKGWINHVLEENASPAIWISNEIQQIDPAYLRRFDYVLEVAVPPRNVRRSVVRRHFAGLVSDEKWFDSVAESEHVTPGDAARAARVVGMADLPDDGEKKEAIELVLDSALKARDLRFKKHAYRYDRESYDLGLLNTRHDLVALVDRLGRRREGTICLYGPPGTGKTAFAHHLSMRLNMELIHKRGSDLLDMYVGGTEANIARMFQSARPERDILLLDEADSFLRDRRKAFKSWEVTQVNELLVQMESFRGMFICSTNLIDDLDQAAFRRFALKIGFDYLTSDQRWTMFERALARGGITPDKGDAKRLQHRLDQLSRLTPGDFAAAEKHFSMFEAVPTPDELLDTLADEASFKPGGKQKQVGFGG